MSLKSGKCSASHTRRRTYPGKDFGNGSRQLPLSLTPVRAIFSREIPGSAAARLGPDGEALRRSIV